MSAEDASGHPKNSLHGNGAWTYTTCMRLAALSVLVVLVTAGWSSCSALQQKRVLSTTPQGGFVPKPESGAYTVVGHLQHRDRVVTIKTGTQGVVYSVQNKDGKILHENLTASQLKAKAPRIHDFIEAAEAGYAGL